MSFDLESLLNEVSRGFSDIEREFGGKKAQEPPDLTVHTTSLASINDAFRAAEGNAGIAGMWVLSPGLEEHGEAITADICALVRQHDGFDPSDQEHAFGLVVHPSVGEIVWQIDYFADENCEQPATDPMSTDQSYRVLSVFTASEVETA
ncbi:hypothetical protein JANAI62_37790 [Jannaschia pagri]|uniref:Uncharacterized protein n=1 Tax=Jannaschia pagri TaxID=2829797 RepID=A0ABQ4NS17_9RHOB|nr:MULTISPECIES: DUF3768 domain-containing protein [unclassified Jannaschia]GIT93359.1 hypothetical protein JANAI61_38170 [Jannaschia sp. AI_61]GIT97156.1 hypothetical protein JANAI62_37790 [Jannaschia sp. AI_62]